MGFSGVIHSIERDLIKRAKKEVEKYKINTMKKEQIYVVINSEPKRLRAIQILSDAKEKSLSSSKTCYQVDVKRNYIYLIFFNTEHGNGGWFIGSKNKGKTEISLDQLEELLNPNFVVKEVVLSIDELQKQAESLGFELVKKERQIKVGDFGKFWDSKDCIVYGFLESISEVEPKFIYKRKSGALYINFAHLTDEEKKQIQENW